VLDAEPPEEVLPLLVPLDPLDVPLEEPVEPLDDEPEDEDPLDAPLVDASEFTPVLSPLLQPPTALSATRRDDATVPNRRKDFMGYLDGN